jgi:hypothetical protein
MYSNTRVQGAPGQMTGYVVDPSGVVIPFAQITITDSRNRKSRTAVADAQGRWVIDGINSGNFKAQAEMQGFRTNTFNLNYDAKQPSLYNFQMNVASAAETVEVTANAPQIETQSAQNQSHVALIGGLAPGVVNQNAASANVVNLQRRVAGVLPVAIDVPRAGTSFSFVRPLVLDEETKVTFTYKSR